MTSSDGTNDRLAQFQSARRQLLSSGGNELPRYPWQHQNSDPDDYALLQFALAQANQHVGSASIQNLTAALTLIDSARHQLDTLEAALLLVARAEGLSWSQIAAPLGVKSPQAAQQRYERLSNRPPLSANS